MHLWAIEGPRKGEGNYFPRIRAGLNVKFVADLFPLTEP